MCDRSSFEKKKKIGASCLVFFALNIFYLLFVLCELRFLLVTAFQLHSRSPSNSKCTSAKVYEKRELHHCLFSYWYNSLLFYQETRANGFFLLFIYYAVNQWLISLLSFVLFFFLQYCCGNERIIICVNGIFCQFSIW